MVTEATHQLPLQTHSASIMTCVALTLTYALLVSLLVLCDGMVKENEVKVEEKGTNLQLSKDEICGGRYALHWYCE